MAELEAKVSLLPPVERTHVINQVSAMGQAESKKRDNFSGMGRDGWLKGLRGVVQLLRS